MQERKLYFINGVVFRALSGLLFFFSTLIFAHFRIKEVGRSRKFGGLQTRNAVAHGTSGGCICDCLGTLSGKVNIALTCY